MPSEVDSCPAACAIAGSSAAGPGVAYRLWYDLRDHGLRYVVFLAVRKAIGLIRRALGQHHSPTRRGVEDSVALKPGDEIYVRSLSEVRATLDANGSNRGLAFLPQMEDFCGRRMRVRSRLNRLYLEESRRMRRLRGTVLLEEAYCDGAGLGCERSCFLFWREEWLRRVDDVPDGETREADPVTCVQSVGD